MISIAQFMSRKFSAMKQTKSAMSAAQSSPQPAGSAALSVNVPSAGTAPWRSAALNELLSFAGVKRSFKWLQIGRTKKRLQMLETVSLGEKRFVALVQVDGRQFLIGGAPSNVGMLAELAPEETFHQVLRDATQGLDGPSASITAALAAPAGLTWEPPVVAAISAKDTASADGPGAQSTAVSHSDLTLDGSLESPFSLSSTMLARMGAEPLDELASGQPALQQEPGTPRDSAVKPAETKPAIAARSAAAPAFTFQLASAFPRAMTAVPCIAHTGFGVEAARRMASAWKLRGATS